VVNRPVLRGGLATGSGTERSDTIPGAGGSIQKRGASIWLSVGKEATEESGVGEGQLEVKGGLKHSKMPSLGKSVPKTKKTGKRRGTTLKAGNSL